MRTFFAGLCPQCFGQVVGLQCGRGKAKLFLREEKDLLCLGSFSKTTGILYPPRRRVREECTADSFRILGGMFTKSGIGVSLDLVLDNPRLCSFTTKKGG